MKKYLQYFNDEVVTEKELEIYFKNNPSDKKKIDYLIGKQKSEKNLDSLDIPRQLKVAEDLQKQTEYMLEQFRVKFGDYEGKSEALAIATEQYNKASQYISKAKASYNQQDMSDYKTELVVLCRTIEETVRRK